MGRDWYKTLFAGAMACIVLALLAVLLAIFAPFDFVKSLAPMAAILFIILGGILVLAAAIYAIYEIATSKNEGTWKAIWILAIFILGIIGLILYELFARKDLKR